MLQCFIPPLRRLYVTLFRFVLQLVGSRQQVLEYASLLGDWVAKLGFSFGFCLIPICPAFSADAASHHTGSLALSYLIVFGPIACLMMMVAFTMVSLRALTAWRRLRRTSKQA